jgi:L-asparaginase
MNAHDRISPVRTLSPARPSTGTAAGSLACVRPDLHPAFEDGRSARARPAARPRVDFLATGGTIASIPDERGDGAAPTLGVEELVRSVPEIAAVADLRAAQFLQLPSTAITFAHLLELRDEIKRRVADGAAGVVVTQGTDTIEETAFALDLLWPAGAPIVITGAMRNPSLPGADGPANLLAAVQLAASPEARGLGALVVFNDEIHGARFVAKVHTSSLSAFRSSPAGPLGWLSEGRPVIAVKPAGRVHVNVPSDASMPPVALVRIALDDDGRLLAALSSLGFAGAVIEGFGGGHVTPPMVPLVERLAAQMPVVLSSRTGSGEVLRGTYRYRGSEIELLELGLVRAGSLNGMKSRVLLSLCLAAGLGRDGVARAFETLAMSSGQGPSRPPALAVVADT